MTQNMGGADRAVRTLVAVVIGVLWFQGILTGTLAAVLGVLAVVLLLTSFIGWCPLYVPFGISTKGHRGVTV